MLKKIIIPFILITFLNSWEIIPNKFNSIIHKHKIVVVKFWAPWCIPCSILETEYKKAKKVLRKNITFLEYNVDKGGKPLIEYNISLLPTIIIFKNGKELDRKSEILDSSTLIEWIKSYKNN